MSKVCLFKYQNNWYNPGSKIKIFFWMIISFVFFESQAPFPSCFKSLMLRLFGAKIGSNVVIKPGCKIKYPWFLFVGNDVWLGERCWIDNLANVTIENDCCISQNAYIFTGNHDYTKSTFDLIISPVYLKCGSWIGAHSIVCPNVIVGQYAVLATGSVATCDLVELGIYQGNPAKFKRYRKL